MSEFVVTFPSFWNFSLAIYGRSGSSERCLALQNDHGFDVNLVLFCIWVGQNWGSMPTSIRAESIEFSTNWGQQVVQPLRKLRTDMKGNTLLSKQLPGDEYEEFRSAVKKLELAAEKKQQAFLESLFSDYQQSSGSGAEASLENLRDVSQRLDIECNTEIQEHFNALIDASEEMRREEKCREEETSRQE